ncbi:MAG: hypothetical protein ABI400_05690 [Lacisediminihabitans sp.]
MVHPPADDTLYPAPDKGYSTTKASASFRHELDSRDHTKVGADWAGGVEPQYGVAPRIRIGRNKWFNLLWLVPIGVVLLIIGIAVAKGLREMPAIQDFIKTYPGTSEQPQGTPVGFPAWLGWQHFLNAFFMIFIIRSGVTILPTIRACTSLGTRRPAKTGSVCRSPFPRTRCIRPSGTRSRCQTESAYPGVATPLASLVGGTSA